MSATENKPAGGPFDQLLGELDTMTKALPAAEVADDNKIAAAADADGDDKPKLDADGKPIAAAPMAKSFQVTLADGTLVDAEDGTELVKSLVERIDGTEETIAKALGGTIDLVKALMGKVTEQGTLVKSLQAQVTELSGQGRGRKTMVSVHEKLAVGGDLAKSDAAANAIAAANDFMVKANAACASGKITGYEMTCLDVAKRAGVEPEASIVAKVLA